MTHSFSDYFVKRSFVGLALSMSMGAASAGLFDDEEARKAILDLRQKIEQSNQEHEAKRVEDAKRFSEDTKRLSEENTTIRRGMIDLQNQLNASRSEVEKLRGQYEQLLREIAEVQRKYKNSTQSLQDRIRNLEPSKVTIDGQDFLASVEETREFDEALNVFRSGDFAAASRLFNVFLGHYGKSGYRPSAMFWLGNAQYANKEYKEAIGSFRNISTDHVRAPEAMLAVANCQVEMKDVKSARKTWETLISTYPDSEAADAARDRLTRFK